MPQFTSIIQTIKQSIGHIEIWINNINKAMREKLYCDEEIKTNTTFFGSKKKQFKKVQLFEMNF